MRDIDFDKSKRDYSRALLSYNPFPSTALPEINPSITADREDAIEMFITMINNVRHNKESTVAIFIGDIGAGKSHILRVLNTNVEEKLYNPKDGVFPILLKSPGRNIIDFLREVFTGIGRVRMTHFANQLIEEYIQKNFEKIKPLVLHNFRDKFAKKEYDLETLLENIHIFDFFKKIRQDLPVAIGDDDLFYAILFLSNEKLRIKSWNWLLGATLTRDEKESLLITESKVDLRRAKIMLKDFVNLILNREFSSIVFFIDEFENIATVPSNQRKIFQDDIRDIIDEFTTKVVLLFAITPPVWKDFEKEPTALTRRLRSNLLYLKQFGKTESKDLISEYLASKRLEDDPIKIKNTFPTCEPKFAPFTENGIDEILSKSEGLVSDILEDCHHALDYFVDNSLSEINASVVKKAIKR